MSEQQYRVIAEGIDPSGAWDNVLDGDRVTVKETELGEIVPVRIERPVSTTDEPVMLTREGCKSYPLGTVAADAGGHWAALHRHYVKTSESTWASFWQMPTLEQITEVVKEARNNLSPYPSGYLAWVTIPPSTVQVAQHPSPHPQTREQIAEVLWRADLNPLTEVTWKGTPPWMVEHYLSRADAVLALIQNGADR